MPFLGSGGSMVARLKLKGIDGRAPPPYLNIAQHYIWYMVLANLVT